MKSNQSIWVISHLQTSSPIFDMLLYIADEVMADVE